MVIGTAIIAYNRPQYFKWLLHSLENQEGAENFEYHAFIDGPKNTPDKLLVSECKKLIEISSLSIKIHEQQKNVGIAVNQFDAREFMSKHYDYFIMVEDDVTLSKHALRLLKMTIPYIKDDIFSSGISFKRRCNPDEINENLDTLVVHQRMHWWCELYKSENWLRVRPHFLKYYEFVKDLKVYKIRPHQKIRDFYKKNGFIEERTSQDSGMDFALFLEGMSRITFSVNRGLYLGETGEHFKPELYEKYELIKQTPYLFEQDKDRKEFVCLA